MYSDYLLKLDQINKLIINQSNNKELYKKIDELYLFAQSATEIENLKNVMINKGFQEKDFLTFERYFLKNTQSDLKELLNIIDSVDINSIPLTPVAYYNILPKNNINPELLKKLWEYKAHAKGIKGVGRSEMFLSLFLKGGESGKVGDVDVFGAPYEVKGVNGRLKGNDKRFRNSFNSGLYISFLEKYSNYVDPLFIEAAKNSSDHIFGFSSGNNLCANSLNNILNNIKKEPKIKERDVFIDWFKTIFENMWGKIEIADIDEIARLNGGYHIGNKNDNNSKPSNDFKYLTCALNLKLYQQEHNFKGLILTNSSESKGGESLCLLTDAVCQNIAECYNFLKSYVTIAQWETYSNNNVFGLTLRK